MKKKIIRISSKRQITIPQEFYKALGFDTKAECMLCGNELIIRPENTTENFAEYILADLITEGLSGDELLREFKSRQTKIRSAVEKIIDETDEVAKGNGEFYTYDDVFKEQ